jgi:hypothetical protein
MIAETLCFGSRPANVCGVRLLEYLPSGQSVSDVVRGRFWRDDFVARDKVFMPAAQ